MKLLKILCIGLATSWCSYGQVNVTNIPNEIPDDLEFDAGGTLYNTATMAKPARLDSWVTIGSKNSYFAQVGIYDYDSILVQQTGPSPWSSYIRFNADSTQTMIRDVEIDSYGNVYLIGSVIDSIIFNPTQKYRYAQEGLIFVKYNASGAYEWHKYISGAIGYDLEINGSNEIVASGRKNNGALFLKKYDIGGSALQQLSSTASTSGFCDGRRVVYDGTDYYITGVFFGTVGIDTETLSTTSEGMYIAKVSGNLSSVYWSDYAYYPGEVCEGTDIELDACNYPVGAGSYRIGADAKMWIYRYHPDGTHLGSITYNGSGTHKYAEVWDMEIQPGANTVYFSGHRADNLYPNNIRKGYEASFDSCLFSVYAYPEKYYTSYSSAPVALMAEPSGGTFYGSGVSGSLFDPAVAGPGVHTVYYTASDCNCSASDTFDIEVKCYPQDNFSEYLNIHENESQNYAHFKRTESDYFTDSIPNPETGNSMPVQRVMTVSTSQSNNGDVYLSLSTDDGEVLWVRNYGGSGRDRGTAVKKSKTGYLVAGTTLSFGSTKQKPFIMKLDANGALSWFKIYEIDNHVLNVNIVELNNGDIAIAGFYNAHEYGGQTHDFFTLVTDANGNINSFRQLGKANRNWEYIRDIEATMDGGFVIVGNTGHNDDYHAGLIMKFDNSYNIQWSNTVRRVLAGGVYNLGVSGQRSNTFLNGVKETSNGEYLVVGRVSDHNGSGANATFRHGVLLKFSNAGNLVSNQMYARNASDFLILHNLDIMQNGNIVMTGKTRDASNREYTPLLVVDGGFQPTLVKEYDFDVKNEALNVWETTSGQFTISGLTGPSGANRKPFVLNTDNNGGSSEYIICDQTLNVTAYSDAMQELPYAWEENTPNHYASAYTIDSTDLCILLKDCSPSGIPADRQKMAAVETMEYDDWLDVEPVEEIKAEDMIGFYPNPSNGFVHFTEAVEEVTLMDVTGRIVLEYSGDKISELQLKGIQRGVYLLQLKVTTNAKGYTNTLVIE